MHKEHFRLRVIMVLLVSLFLSAAAVPAWGQTLPDLPGASDDPLAKGLAAPSTPAKDPVKISAEFTAAAAGKPARLFITAAIIPGAAVDDPPPEGGGSCNGLKALFRLKAGRMVPAPSGLQEVDGLNRLL